MSDKPKSILDELFGLLREEFPKLPKMIAGMDAEAYWAMHDADVSRRQEKDAVDPFYYIRERYGLDLTSDFRIEEVVPYSKLQEICISDEPAIATTNDPGKLDPAIEKYLLTLGFFKEPESHNKGEAIDNGPDIGSPA